MAKSTLSLAIALLVVSTGIALAWLLFGNSGSDEPQVAIQFEEPPQAAAEQASAPASQSQGPSARATVTQGTAPLEDVAGLELSADSELSVQVESDLEATDLMSLDPRQDGWEIEHFNELANQQLATVGKIIEAGDYSDTKLTPIATEEFASLSLIPSDLAQVYQQGSLIVQRGENPTADKWFRGIKGLGLALQELIEPLAFERGETHVKFKVTRVTPSEDGVETQQLYSASCVSPTGVAEQRALWTIQWKWNGGDQLPVISRIETRDFEQSTNPLAPGPMFVDCTRAAFASLPSDVLQQMTAGVDRWIRQIEYYLGAYQFGHMGIAIGDVNGDGLEDIYRCQMGGMPNRLWLAQADGTLVEASRGAGVDFYDSTRAALFADLDNDGDQDLTLALPKSILILQNDGSGKFEVAQSLEGIFQPFSLAAVDFDQDADLDLYACVYFAESDIAAEFPVPMPLYDAHNGGRNRLLRNDGKLSFADVTSEVGLDADNDRFSYAVVCDDFDNDQDVDIYVANDFGKNSYYVNEGKRFREASAEMGLSDGAFGMSAAAADYNRDGWMDIYKANMFSSAGNRVTHASQFMPEATESHKDRFRLLARGNTLFRNREGKFEDVSVETGVTQGRWSWGSMFVDLNNDGWEDLLVANGFMTGSQLDDL